MSIAERKRRDLMLLRGVYRAKCAPHLRLNTIRAGRTGVTDIARPFTAMVKEPYTLYTAGTPNGVKASITLEELGLSYETHAINIWKGEHKQDWYKSINPNARIPALVDHENGDLAVFETGAIMYYLADKHPEKGLWGKDATERAKIMSWLMFQMSGIGPMQGQATFFVTFSSTQFDYPIKRFVDETYRLYGVLEIGLQNADYLANDKYSIADIATFTWVAFAFFSGITTEKFPKLTAWAKRIQERPAVKKGLAVPNQMPIWQYLYCTEPQPDLQKKLEDGKRKYQEAVAALEKG